MYLKKYEEILNNYDTNQINLLLGNGFCINYNESFKIISNREISSTNKKESDALLEDKLKTEEIERNDKKTLILESVLASLSKSPSPSKDESLKKIYKHSNSTLQNILPDLIEIHPIDANSISEESVKSFESFLKPYLKNGKIFTINYDMLLQWTIAKAYKNKKVNDGFTKKQNAMLFWEKNPKQNVFYCHGALDIKKSNNGFFKRDNMNMTLQELVSDKYACVLVSAQTAEEKLNIINTYDYLINCLEELKSISGSLVIIGVSFMNDDHILDAIKIAQQKSELNIFYGALDIEDADNKESLLNEKGITNITFFNVNTAPIWRKQLS